MKDEKDEGLCVDCNEITPGDFCPNCDGSRFNDLIHEARFLMQTESGRDRMREDIARWSTR